MPTAHWVATMPARDHAWTKALLDELQGIAVVWQGEWFQITDTAIDRVDDCPAQAVGGEFPGWNSVRASRQVGLAAAQSGRNDARDAVRDGMKDLLHGADPEREFLRVQDWLATLTPTARLDVADEALRWLVAWRSIAPAVSAECFVTSGYVRCSITEHVALRINVDLLLREPGSADRTAFVSIGGPPDRERDEAAAARVAVAMWLRRQSIGAVVVAHPTSRSTQRFEITRELVEFGATQFRSALRTLTRHRAGLEQAPPVAGPQCHWCELRSECVEGRVYLAANPHTPGGLPIP